MGYGIQMGEPDSNKVVMTPEGRQRQILAARIVELERERDASRALVAEKDEALRVAVIVVRYGVQCGCGDVDYCRTCEAKLIVPPAFALTEADMLKRMEEK